VPDPRRLDKAMQNLMIFDDLQLEKRKTCEKYYVSGKHSYDDCFYLAQSYFRLPRQTVRENASFICLSSKNLKNVNFHMPAR
jgi:hypothetical protein